MSKFIVSIDTDNAVFDTDERGYEQELYRLLQIVAKLVSQGQYGGYLMDANGNMVGHFAQEA